MRQYVVVVLSVWRCGCQPQWLPSAACVELLAHDGLATTALLGAAYSPPAPVGELLRQLDFPGSQLHGSHAVCLLLVCAAVPVSEGGCWLCADGHVQQSCPSMLRRSCCSYHSSGTWPGRGLTGFAMNSVCVSLRVGNVEQHVFVTATNNGG